MQGFVAQVVPFVAQGLAAGESTLIAVGPRKIEAMQQHFGPRSDLTYADIEDVGRNPARLIPLWLAFADEHRAQSGGFRGVGEPMWGEQTPDEMVECERHEALLNVAFENGPSWILGCPYDTAALGEATLSEARRNHPLVTERAQTTPSDSYRGLGDIARPISSPLPEPPGSPAEFSFGAEGLGTVRDLVSGLASGYGMAAERVDDLVLATDEIAANSVRHGGGMGVLRCWLEGPSVVCEVRDDGTFAELLAGRRAPVVGQESGFGLWLANQLCDLLQIRSFDSGSVVRLHMRVTAPSSADTAGL